MQYTLTFYSLVISCLDKGILNILRKFNNVLYFLSKGLCVRYISKELRERWYLLRVIRIIIFRVIFTMKFNLYLLVLVSRYIYIILFPIIRKIRINFYYFYVSA